jgi:hypothetical protein
MIFLAPDAVYDVSEAGIGTFKGLEAIRGFLEDWHGSCDDFVAEAEEILDLGHGVVFVGGRENGRLVGSEGRVEQRLGQVFIWASSKIDWAKAYRDPDEARAAAERLAQERADG